ncbi:transcription factor TFIIF complex subunit Tfg3 [Friedmanniomyces endolithicus]|nr:transcription factor TFIIF complex subunit Tfg3 [Friedmanniomyces endolithicus]
MRDVKRTVKLITRQSATDEMVPDSGVPMRAWSIEIYLVGPEGDDLPATCFEKAVYVLHESFGNRKRQTFKTPPFTVKEKGWGEFDMQIILSPVGGQKGGDQIINHDLNFAQEEYESTHSVTFRNPKDRLLELLRDSAPASEAVNGASASKPEKKRQKTSRNVDMEKLADALPLLQEDDLLQVVQMVHDNKTEDTYTKNDTENGEFHVDLYTLPDPLIKMLWDFCDKKMNMNDLTA